jgi:NitT/TauT family transport system substrate-binding protein
MRKAVVVFACLAVQTLATAHAESVVVSNYGVTTNGMPFAVAMDKGFFKEAGVNVDGVLTSDGGGTTIRNLLGGKLAYGEAAVSAVVSAVQGGADGRARRARRSPSSSWSGWASKKARSSSCAPAASGPA